jgi:hypothetical protein
MSDEAKKRSRRWMWWTPIAAIALYLLSSVPVVLITAWMAEVGVVSERRAIAFVNTVYAPLNWANEHSKTVSDTMGWIGDRLRPIAPPSR